eukprot:Gb_19861 [translate_table: standard]
MQTNLLHKISNAQLSQIRQSSLRTSLFYYSQCRVLQPNRLTMNDEYTEMPQIVNCLLCNVSHKRATIFAPCSFTKVSLAPLFEVPPASFKPQRHAPFIPFANKDANNQLQQPQTPANRDSTVCSMIFHDGQARMPQLAVYKKCDRMKFHNFFLQEETTPRTRDLNYYSQICSSPPNTNSSSGNAPALIRNVRIRFTGNKEINHITLQIFNT